MTSELASSLFLRENLGIDRLKQRLERLPGLDIERNALLAGHGLASIVVVVLSNIDQYLAAKIRHADFLAGP